MLHNKVYILDNTQPLNIYGRYRLIVFENPQLASYSTIRVHLTLLSWSLFHSFPLKFLVPLLEGD